MQNCKKCSKPSVENKMVQCKHCKNYYDRECVKEMSADSEGWGMPLVTSNAKWSCTICTSSPGRVICDLCTRKMQHSTWFKACSKCARHACKACVTPEDRKRSDHLPWLCRKCCESPNDKPDSWNDIKIFAEAYVRFPSLLKKDSAKTEETAHAYRRLAESLGIHVSLVPQRCKRFEAKFKDILRRLAYRYRSPTSLARHAPSWVTEVEAKLKWLPEITKSLWFPDAPVSVLRELARRVWATRTRRDKWRSRAIRELSERLACDALTLQDLWHQTIRLAMHKLETLSLLGDSEESLVMSSRLQDYEWRAIDATVLHGEQKLHWWLIGYLSSQFWLLYSLIRLVQQFSLEGCPSDERCARWLSAYKHYTDSELTTSVIVLQRRWWELKIETNRAFMEFSRVLPHHVVIARRYPHVVTEPMLTWQDMRRRNLLVDVSRDEANRFTGTIDPLPIAEDDLILQATNRLCSTDAPDTRTHDTNDPRTQQMVDQLKREVRELKDLDNMQNLNLGPLIQGYESDLLNLEQNDEDSLEALKEANPNIASMNIIFESDSDTPKDEDDCKIVETNIETCVLSDSSDEVDEPTNSLVVKCDVDEVETSPKNEEISSIGSIDLKLIMIPVVRLARIEDQIHRTKPKIPIRDTEKHNLGSMRPPENGGSKCPKDITNTCQDAINALHEDLVHIPSELNESQSIERLPNTTEKNESTKSLVTCQEAIIALQEDIEHISSESNERQCSKGSKSTPEKKEFTKPLVNCQDAVKAIQRVLEHISDITTTENTESTDSHSATVSCLNNQKELVDHKREISANKNHDQDKSTVKPDDSPVKSESTNIPDVTTTSQDAIRELHEEFEVAEDEAKTCVGCTSLPKESKLRPKYTGPLTGLAKDLVLLCRPVSVSLEPLPAEILSKARAYYSKPVRLPDIEQVRRDNRRLLVAQVAPQHRHSEESSASRRQHRAMSSESSTTSISSTSHSPQSTDDQVGGSQGRITEEDLMRVLVSIQQAPDFLTKANRCCLARRHRAYNDARKRSHVRRGVVGRTFDLHGSKHPGACNCCCMYLLKEPPPQNLATLQKTLVKSLDALLKKRDDPTIETGDLSKRARTASSSDDERLVMDVPPPPKTAKVTKNAKTKRRGGKKKRTKPPAEEADEPTAKKTKGSSDTQTADDEEARKKEEYDEWMRQKNSHRKFFQPPGCNTPFVYLAKDKDNIVTKTNGYVNVRKEHIQDHTYAHQRNESDTDSAAETAKLDQCPGTSASTSESMKPDLTKEPNFNGPLPVSPQTNLVCRVTSEARIFKQVVMIVPSQQPPALSPLEAIPSTSQEMNIPPKALKRVQSFPVTVTDKLPTKKVIENIDADERKSIFKEIFRKKMVKNLSLLSGGAIVTEEDSENKNNHLEEPTQSQAPSPKIFDELPEYPATTLSPDAFASTPSTSTVPLATLVPTLPTDDTVFLSNSPVATLNGVPMPTPVLPTIATSNLVMSDSFIVPDLSWPAEQTVLTDTPIMVSSLPVMVSPVPNIVPSIPSVVSPVNSSTTKVSAGPSMVPSVPPVCAPQMTDSRSMPTITCVRSLAQPDDNDDDCVITTPEEPPPKRIIVIQPKMKRSSAPQYVNPMTLYAEMTRHISEVAPGADNFSLLRVDCEQQLWSLPGGHLVLTDTAVPCRNNVYFVINSPTLMRIVPVHLDEPEPEPEAAPAGRIQVRAFAREPDRPQSRYDLVTKNNKLFKRLTKNVSTYVKVLTGLTDLASARALALGGHTLYTYAPRADVLRAVHAAAGALCCDADRRAALLLADAFNKNMEPGDISWNVVASAT